jgi:hypothetical protein
MAKQETVKMLNTREVAERLESNPGTVRMWCINGTFPNAVQEETPRGPIWLIPETDLVGFERRGPGRPKTQFGIFSPDYREVAASPKWAELPKNRQNAILLTEIEKRNAELNAPRALPGNREENLRYARRIIDAFEKEAAAPAQESGPPKPAAEGKASRSGSKTKAEKRAKRRTKSSKKGGAET